MRRQIFEEGDIIMKTIVVACGGGVATSQTCAVKLAESFRKERDQSVRVPH